MEIISVKLWLPEEVRYPVQCTFPGIWLKKALLFKVCVQVQGPCCNAHMIVCLLVYMVTTQFGKVKYLTPRVHVMVKECTCRAQRTHHYHACMLDNIEYNMQ